MYPSSVRVRKSTRVSLRMVVTYYMSPCVASLNAAAQPHLLSSFCTGRVGELVGRSGREAMAKLGDSEDSGKAVPGWVRVPWLQRGGHKLGLDWRAWKLLHIFWNIYKSTWDLHFFNLWFLWPCLVACGILVPQPGIEPTSPALEAWSQGSPYLGSFNLTFKYLHQL